MLRHLASASLLLFLVGLSASLARLLASGSIDVAGPAPTFPGAPGDKGGMVLVSGGPFYMGCNDEVDSECDLDEKPGRIVNLPAYEIGRFEVTVEMYGTCVRAGVCTTAGVTMPYSEGKEHPGVAEHCNWGKLERALHPMNCVEWFQARVFCEWSGKRLPSEAEWAKAARGSDGRKYPWGNAGYDTSGLVANIADESARRRYADWPVAEGYDDGYVGTAPVGSFPAGASPYGAHDMVGNVWEWVEDRAGRGRRIRGGSWVYLIKSARASNRRAFDPRSRVNSVGLRCARDIRAGGTIQE